MMIWPGMFQQILIMKFMILITMHLNIKQWKEKIQSLFVHNTPDRLTFFSLNNTNDLERNVIYVRRGNKVRKQIQKK